MRIDIWSDVICPWCYLGSRRLRSALEIIGRDDIEVRWHAFQLDPNAPLESGELRSRLEHKYGPGSFDAMTSRLTELGRSEGIDYRFDKALSPNTADAHRLIAWAFDVGGVGAQNELVDRLFLGYFTNGEDYSEPEALLDAVEGIGMDRRAAAAVLAGDAFRQEIEADQHQANESGISGVPAFVIDGQWLIPGAQETDRFVALIRKALSNTDQHVAEGQNSPS